MYLAVIKQVAMCQTTSKFGSVQCTWSLPYDEDEWKLETTSCNNCIHGLRFRFRRGLRRNMVQDPRPFEANMFALFIPVKLRHRT